ncbi:MAG TPA: DUF3142 domain-containing protein [Bryobacteraceae bacterium]|jgi:uncharacterized protein DUF3142|nr:DUF3142 domain-containing protein [Bryobacteraceae bacterium]
MRRWPMWLRWLLLIAAVMLVPNLLNFVTKRWFHRGDPLIDSLPLVFLWAWERPEDLRFLQPSEAGIAVLLAHIYMEGEGAPRMERRKQHLLLTPQTPLMAVVRIETKNASGNQAQAMQTVDQLFKVFDDSRLVAAQIDYDAGTLDRPFYASLLQRLRDRLPQRLPLSVTSLASWCDGDRWMKALPVDEAVPMLFRMGPDRDTIRRKLAAGDEFPEPLCQGSLGISTDELLRPPSKWEGRVYLFHPKPWTKEAYEAALKELQ